MMLQQHQKVTKWMAFSPPPALRFASVASASDACWDTWSEQVCEEGQEEAGVVVGVRAGVVSGVGRHPTVLPH